MVGATGAAVASIWPLDAFSYRELGRFGRLGDQLKQISGTLGIANSKGTRALFPGGWRYRRWFSLPDSAYAGRVSLARCTEAWPLATTLEPRARRYLGDISLWQDSEAQVRRWLRPSAAALELISARHESLLTIPSKTAVHVRRGDFTHGHRWFPPCPIRYYDLAVAQITAEHPETQLLVFSDDIPWCREHLGLSDAIHLEGNDDWVDLFLMSLCQHHVIANSTFSWWGAFLSENRTPIYPWLIGVHERGGDWDQFPAGWRTIEVDP